MGVRCFAWNSLNRMLIATVLKRCCPEPHRVLAQWWDMRNLDFRPC